MVGETIPFRREMIHHESFRASVLNHSDNNAVLHSIAAKKCLLTTPSLLSRGTRESFFVRLLFPLCRWSLFARWGNNVLEPHIGDKIAVVFHVVRVVNVER